MCIAKNEEILNSSFEKAKHLYGYLNNYVTIMEK